MSAFLYTCPQQHTTQRFYVGAQRRTFIRCPECGNKWNQEPVYGKRKVYA